jgi:replicative DNA helicase
MADRVPPSDVEAERAVVSACLLVQDSLAIVRDMLKPEQLYDPTCRKVLEAAFAVDDSGARIDAITLSTQMRDNGDLQSIGGTPKLAELFDASPDPTHVSEHAQIVADKYRLRRVAAVCKIHSVASCGDVGPVGNYCDSVEREILDATDPGSRVDAPQTIAEVLKGGLLQEITERQAPGASKTRSGRTTGLYELDALMCGGYDDAFYVVAGRPGSGKSAFVNCQALAIAAPRAITDDGVVLVPGGAVVLFSLEMPKEQIVMRLLAETSLVPYNIIKSEQMNREEWNALLTASDYLAKLPISIQHRPGAHVAQVRSTLRREFSRLKRTHGADPGLGVVDYLQLVGGERPKGATRDEEIGSISRVCMALPAEFKCPILGVAQLNREVEKRPNKRPQLSDLRESGALEQDAYGILFLYRDEYYHEETDAKGIAEVNLAKNRNGKTGTINCKFDGPCVRFSSLTQQLRDDIDEIDAGINPPSYEQRNLYE